MFFLKHIGDKDLSASSLCGRRSQEIMILEWRCKEKEGNETILIRLINRFWLWTTWTHSCLGSLGGFKYVSFPTWGQKKLRHLSTNFHVWEIFPEALISSYFNSALPMARLGTQVQRIPTSKTLSGTYSRKQLESNSTVNAKGTMGRLPLVFDRVTKINYKEKKSTWKKDRK